MLGINSIFAFKLQSLADSYEKDQNYILQFCTLKGSTKNSMRWYMSMYYEYTSIIILEPLENRLTFKLNPQ